MTVDPLYIPIVFRTSIQLPPKDLAGATGSFDDMVRDRLQEKLQGVCTRYGYILPGSLQVIKRSMGTFIKQHFNGYIVFQVVCQAKACNPPIGSVVLATVRNKNDLGIHADGQGVLDIIIPKKSAGITSEIDLDALNPGDPIYVEILGKRFTLHDKKISIIGRCLRDKKKMVPRQDQPVVLAEPEEGKDMAEPEEEMDEIEEDVEEEEMVGGQEEEEEVDGYDGGDAVDPEDMEDGGAVVILENDGASDSDLDEELEDPIDDDLLGGSSDVEGQDLEEDGI